ALGGAKDARVEALALPGGALLGVVELAEGAPIPEAEALEIDQHRGGDQRTGERAAAGLVGAGHEAGAERAVEVEQAGGPAAAPGHCRFARSTHRISCGRLRRPYTPVSGLKP